MESLFCLDVTIFSHYYGFESTLHLILKGQLNNRQQIWDFIIKMIKKFETEFPNLVEFVSYRKVVSCLLI